MDLVSVGKLSLTPDPGDQILRFCLGFRKPNCASRSGSISPATSARTAREGSAVPVKVP
jgi:hypothetical protein